MKPRNLKNALENGYIVKRIDCKGSKKISVILEQRFYNKRDWPVQLSFWLDREYFKRTYPHLYERF